MVISKLTALIVDDELFGRENLKKIFESYCPEIEVIACADSAIAAKELTNLHHPDVVFLDINMPVLNGFDFLDEFENRDFLVVFVSAHEEFGIRAVKAGAADYILKPINIKELKQTVKNLLNLKNREIIADKRLDFSKLVIPASHGFDLVPYDDIIRLEANGCYTIIVVKNSKNKVISRTLKEFEETLPGDLFLRVHKSHLLNLKYVKEYSNFGGSHITMSDGSKVELARRKVSEFVLRIKSMLKSI